MSTEILIIDDNVDIRNIIIDLIVDAGVIKYSDNTTFPDFGRPEMVALNNQQCLTITL